jgi:hypothetical protein
MVTSASRAFLTFVGLLTSVLAPQVTAHFRDAHPVQFSQVVAALSNDTGNQLVCYCADGNNKKVVESLVSAFDSMAFACAVIERAGLLTVQCPSFRHPNRAAV